MTDTELREKALAKLTVPSSDEEEREELEYFYNESPQVFETVWTKGCVLARSLRAKTLALREAEAKISALEKRP